MKRKSDSIFQKMIVKPPAICGLILQIVCGRFFMNIAIVDDEQMELALTETYIKRYIRQKGLR